MRAKLSLAVASVLVSVLAATAPAEAACKRFGFTVNDYGKEGPTNDAKNLLDKHIAEWAAQNGVAAYQTGKKSVNCELFLDVVLFDEHTCTASANVCWGDGVKPNNKGAEQAEATDAGNGEIPPAPVSKAVALGIPAQQQTAAAPATDAAACRPSTPLRRRRSSRSPLRPRRQRQLRPSRPPLLHLHPRRRRRRRRPLSRPARCRPARASPLKSKSLRPPPLLRSRIVPPQQPRRLLPLPLPSVPPRLLRRPPTPPRKPPPPRLRPAPPARPRLQSRRSTKHRRVPSQQRNE